MAETARCVPATGENGDLRVFFHCPGCGDNHQVRVAPDAHGWDGDVEFPTFVGSVQVLGRIGSDPRGVCHSLVQGGRIEFLVDCTHELVGQTVDLPVWPPVYELCALCGRRERQHGSWIDSHRFTPAESGEASR